MTVPAKTAGDSLQIAPLDSAGINACAIHQGLGAFSAYGTRRAPVVRDALSAVLRMPGGEVVAALDGRTIVAYLLMGPVVADDPWGRPRDPRILEVAIEVARGYRNRGIAEALFRYAFNRPQVESRIYVATGYVWCWDLERAHHDAATYARRLLALFERFGFRREWTDDGNIRLNPFNFLAVRIGHLVPADLIQRFRQSLRRRRVA